MVGRAFDMTMAKLTPSELVLMSDDFDEIDWEWSGNDFGFQNSKGMVQNNYFAKGITGTYDRGMFVNIASPQTQWHTYSVDWSPTAIKWLIDGNVVRTFLASDADTTTHQFPQTPSKLQLGLWDGGDQGENSGTVSWAGGYTDVSKAPFTMYVKSVKITNANPAYAYNYTDHSGKWQSIQKIQDPHWNAAASSASSKPSSAVSSPVLKATINTKQDSSAASSATTMTSSAPTSNVPNGVTSTAGATQSDAASNMSSTPGFVGASSTDAGRPAVTTSTVASLSTSCNSASLSSSALSQAAASPSSVSAAKTSALSSVLSAAPAAQSTATSTSGNQLCEFAGLNPWFRLFNLIPFLGGNFLGFNIQCNVDYPGSDFAVMNTPDFSTCVHNCNNWRGSASCDACAFVPDTQQCYFKNFARGKPRAVTPARKTYCGLGQAHVNGWGRWRKRSAHLRRHAKGSIHRRR
ncbi:MAG: hypothetical protein Q9159_007210 [Coniocarpon cinnabarinum]